MSAALVGRRQDPCLGADIGTYYNLVITTIKKELKRKNVIHIHKMQHQRTVGPGGTKKHFNQ